MSDSAQVIGRVWNKISRGPVNLRQEGSIVDYIIGSVTMLNSQCRVLLLAFPTSYSNIGTNHRIMFCLYARNSESERR